MLYLCFNNISFIFFNKTQTLQTSKWASRWRPSSSSSSSSWASVAAAMWQNVNYWARSEWESFDAVLSDLEATAVQPRPTESVLLSKVWNSACARVDTTEEVTLLKWWETWVCTLCKKHILHRGFLGNLLRDSTFSSLNKYGTDFPMVWVL